MKRILVLVGTVALFAVVASTAMASAAKEGSSKRQLTGTVTSVTTRSITVKAGPSSLTCAARTGMKLSAFAGKKATLSCRMVAGRLVVSKVRSARLAHGTRPSNASASSPAAGSGTGSSSSRSSSDDDSTADDSDDGAADDDATDDDSDDDDSDDDEDSSGSDDDDDSDDDSSGSGGGDDD